MDSPSSPIAAKQTKRILLIEDERPIRDILEQVLVMEGFLVETAENGIEAMKILRESHFHLVITDLIMPGKDGIELILELRGFAPNIKIIAMSGGIPGSSRDCLPLARTLGATAVIKKPFHRESLLDTVSAVLAPRLMQMAY